MKIEYKGETYDVRIDSIALEEYIGKLSYYEMGITEFIKTIKDAASSRSKTAFVHRQGGSYFLQTPNNVDEHESVSSYDAFDDSFNSHVPKNQVWILPGCQGSPEIVYDKQAAVYRNGMVRAQRIDNLGGNTLVQQIIRRKAHPNTLKSTTYNLVTWKIWVTSTNKDSVVVCNHRNENKYPTGTQTLKRGCCYVAGRLSSFDWYDENKSCDSFFGSGEPRNPLGLQRVNCYRFRPVGRGTQDKVGLVTRSIPKYRVYDTIMKNIKGCGSILIPMKLDALDPDAAIKVATNWRLSALATIVNPVSAVGGNNIVQSGSCYWQNDVGVDWWQTRDNEDPVEYGVALLQDTETIEREILDPLSDDYIKQKVITLPMPIVSGFNIASITHAQTNVKTDTTWIVPDWLRMPDDILSCLGKMDMDELALAYMRVSRSGSISSVMGVDSGFWPVVYGENDFEYTDRVKTFERWVDEQTKQYTEFLDSQIDVVRRLYSNILIHIYSRHIMDHDIVIVGANNLILDGVRIQQAFKQRWIKNKQMEEMAQHVQEFEAGRQQAQREREEKRANLTDINVHAPMLPHGSIDISGGNENEEEVQ